MTTVRIRVLTEGAPVPSFAHADDAGADLAFWPSAAWLASQAPGIRDAGLDAVVLWPHQRLTLPCGFAMALERGWEAQVRPRSGLAAKHGIGIVNAPGTIDAGYHGEVCVVLVNHGNTAVAIRKGDRIAQLCVRPVPEVAFEVVDDLGDSERGGNGFGSSGR